MNTLTKRTAAAELAQRQRADILLVDRGLAPSRQKAQALIMAGLVYSGEERVEKPGQVLRADRALAVRATLPFVSRGGLKLEQALEAFGVSVEGRVAADLGASTGGFTDCLLKRGARRVMAVDVDTKQLDCHLREDPRVVLVEKNARFLQPGDLPEKPEVITADLSFISILKVLPALTPLLNDAPLLVLIKPQFEAGRGQVGKKGVIRDPAVHAAVLTGVIEAARELGFNARGLIRCSTRGQKGNQEFFIHWSRSGSPWGRDRILTLIREATGHEKD
jgi:23S rRNA (cytidine1920-2'-O)/16S rRNA (cytidine1409-2'-O)-methyltransferase